MSKWLITLLTDNYGRCLSFLAMSSAVMETPTATRFGIRKPARHTGDQMSRLGFPNCVRRLGRVTALEKLLNIDQNVPRSCPDSR